MEQYFCHVEKAVSGERAPGCSGYPLYRPYPIHRQEMHQCLDVLRPFQQATVELSKEKWVTASKVIPLVKMLNHYISSRCGHITHPLGEYLATNLNNNLSKKFAVLEKVTALGNLTGPYV